MSVREATAAAVMQRKASERKAAEVVNGQVIGQVRFIATLKFWQARGFDMFGEPFTACTYHTSEQRAREYLRGLAEWAGVA